QCLSTKPACSEASDCGESSPMPVICEPEENYPSLQMCSAETPHTETVSLLPSSMDLLIQDSPDSSTSPKGKQPAAAESSATTKEDKLCVLNDRFQRQKYLSLQQIILNLSYKQVKTWWQKNNWPKNTNDVPQASAPTYPSLYSSDQQGCLVNTTGNLPMWSNQTWSNSTWSNQTQNIQFGSNHSWNTQTWCTHSWNTQTWCTHFWNTLAWNSPFYNCGEESLQSCVQFQSNSSASDLEAALETAGENHNTTRCLSIPQAMELLLNYSMNMHPEDVRR
uniref:Homeobox domain-containing protein n=1 Tax=Saimiri boliviensis boliviensis TaxID=39432 RepID=A0A2K6V387_SAIBB